MSLYVASTINNIKNIIRACLSVHSYASWCPLEQIEYKSFMNCSTLQRASRTSILPEWKKVMIDTHHAEFNPHVWYRSPPYTCNSANSAGPMYVRSQMMSCVFFQPIISRQIDIADDVNIRQPIISTYVQLIAHQSEKKTHLLISWPRSKWLMWCWIVHVKRLILQNACSLCRSIFSL